jgi:hypothetical protein
MSDRQYVIINTDELSTINFDHVLETSVDTLRYNVAGDQTFVKYEGAKPRCLYGKDTLSHSAMLTVLADESWTTSEEF